MDRSEIQKNKPPLNYAELIKQLNKSCEQAFNTLFNQYIEPVTKYAYGICRNTDMANDVAQDVFVKVWDKRKTLDPERSFKYFLFVLTRNIIVSHFRKHSSYKKYRAHFQHVNSVADESLAHQINANELFSILKKAIETLPARRKTVFQLSRDERLTYREIGERLNISPRTVEVHIALALKNIRAYLNLQYGRAITMVFVILYIF